MKRNKLQSLPNALCLTAAILLIVALAFHLPYGFFTFLRIYVCGVALYMAWLALQEEVVEWTVAFLLIAVLFNPIFKTYLSRPVWFPIDLIVAFAFVARMFVKS